MARRRGLRLTFSDAAERDLHAIHDYIAHDRPMAAARWLRQVKRKVDSLKTMPLAFEVIPEDLELGFECRHFIHGNYRIIFQVEANRINIIRIVHAARLLTRPLLGLEPPPEAEL